MIINGCNGTELLPILGLYWGKNYSVKRANCQDRAMLKYFSDMTQHSPFVPFLIQGT